MPSQKGKNRLKQTEGQKLKLTSKVELVHVAAFAHQCQDARLLDLYGSCKIQFSTRRTAVGLLLFQNVPFHTNKTPLWKRESFVVCMSNDWVSFTLNPSKFIHEKLQQSESN